MPVTDQISVIIGDYEVLSANPEDLPISISYSLEDPDNFQSKKSGESFDIITPAITENSQAANTFNNSGIDDLTSGKAFRSFRPAQIIANGMPLLSGKGILKGATHDANPIDFKWNIYGDNSDWLIEMKELTLYDVLKNLSFTLNKSTIENSWAADGTNEALPYVFAPVRYRQPLGGYSSVAGNLTPVNDNVIIQSMRPAIFKYWVIYWAFKSLGYRIETNFLNTSYYRRMTMPWTWGNFLDSEGTRLDTHKFLAKSEQAYFENMPTGGAVRIIDVKASNDSHDGGFDNNGDYQYTGAYEMQWTYQAPNYGLITARFEGILDINADVFQDCTLEYRIQWYKNNVLFDSTDGSYATTGNLIINTDAPIVGQLFNFSCDVDVNPGDIIKAKVYCYSYKSKNRTADMRMTVSILEFKIAYFKIPIGGLIDFANYSGLKKFKFLDFLAGECDLYDLSINTDSVQKKVLIEPTHAYSLIDDQSTKTGGYFVDDCLDWDDKKDFSKKWEIELYSEGDRELQFTFKDDTNDGILKVIQDRKATKIAAGKYNLPERFKSGKKPIENRFFSPTMHVEVDEFKSLGTGLNTGISPQFICLIPENISNTSQSESENTFVPKSAYYKGLINGVGAWKWDGSVLQNFPYMFAVNYKDGGQNDPIISYCDQKIKSGSSHVIGKGLLKRFFWQRLAIARNGQRYPAAWLSLNNNDVASSFHREFKILFGHKWELIQIQNYYPLKNESTRCLLYKWVPITQEDNDNTFPSALSILNDDLSSNQMDMQYSEMKCLITDIPNK